MTLPATSLFIAPSILKEAGMGLFTNTFICKGTLIVEYKGKITTWQKVLSGRTFNGYVYYINRNHVIDARPFKKHLARYANDAAGLSKIKGLSNNCVYTIIKKQVYTGMNIGMSSKKMQRGNSFLTTEIVSAFLPIFFYNFPSVLYLRKTARSILRLVHSCC